MSRTETLCWVGLICMIVGAVYLGVFTVETTPPPLIGFGCDGAHGPIYAHSESDFPHCKRIERVRA